MENYIFIIGRYLVISGLLLLIYEFLLKGRSTYRFRRITLLAIPILSLVASILNFEVIPIGDKSPTSVILENFVATSSEPTTMQENPVVTLAEDMVFAEEGLDLSGINFWLVAWCVGAFAFLMVYINGVRAISRFKKLSKIERWDDKNINRCGLISTPFSYMHDIYIDRQIEGEKLDVILQHEAAHIDNKHYIDKFCVEMMVILSWFNPVVWIIRKKIGVIHEFEADRVVIDRGEDVKKYQLYIFDEVSATTPALANGFNNSLIKQRFLEMKTNNLNQKCLVRKTLAIVATTMVLTLSSLTYVEATVVTETKNVEFTTIDGVKKDFSYETSTLGGEQDINIGQKVSYSVFKDSAIKFIIPTKYFSDDITNAAVLIPQNKLREDVATAFGVNHDGSIKLAKYKDGSVKIIGASDAIPTIAPIDFDAENVREIREAINTAINQYLSKPRRFTLVNKEAKPKEKIDFYTLKSDQYMIVDNSFYKNNSNNNIKVYRYKDHTEVDIIMMAYGDPHWFGLSDECYLIDNKSNTRYKIHSQKYGIPLNRYSWMKGQARQAFVVTYIFPPLEKGVKEVDFLEFVIKGPRPSNNDGRSQWLNRNLRVNIDTVRPYKDIRNLKSLKVIELDKDFKVSK